MCLLIVPVFVHVVTFYTMCYLCSHHLSPRLCMCACVQLMNGNTVAAQDIIRLRTLESEAEDRDVKFMALQKAVCTACCLFAHVAFIKFVFVFARHGISAFFNYTERP